ncbi:Abi family protein [Cellulosimicrobium funkei]|uniref:Abi family protein n=1 Tax=Cellulosimicrobium funkei TaxID=264251 RepID=UPI00203EE19E|nr:Abi family protein [Cellulosimicrobium funkei]MCM3533277.1 Abi family protein [Cellulosimicrobium funkei]
MIERGLVVPEPERAARYVRHVGYYRFSPYLIPFRKEPGAEALRGGTTFDQVLDLYVFDRKLRLLVMDALERIEVAVRSSLTDHMSVHRGGPSWYCEPEHFRDERRHQRFLEMVRKTCEDRLASAPESAGGDLAHASALEHYLTTYGEPTLPPSWLMVETLTLGQLSGLVGNLRRASDVGRVARPLGLPGPLLLSWLRTYVRVRNVCAHHGRLWNVGLGVYPAIPTSSSVRWLTDEEVLSSSDRRKRLYPVLASLQSVLAVVSPRSSWARRLGLLLDQHPDVPLAGMGIPQGWRSDPFWSHHLAAVSTTRREGRP